MKKGKIDLGYERYYETTKNIANLLLQQISQKMIFKAKLNALKTNVKGFEGNTQGSFTAKREDNIVVDLYVNKNDNPLLIEIVIAHELTHLLFAVFANYADYCATDESFAVSSVERKAKGVKYGKWLEEELCNYIAIDIVYKLHKKNVSKEELIKVLDTDAYKFSKSNYNLVEKVIKMFERVEVTEDDKYDDYVFTKTGTIIQKNHFLYGICTGHLNVIVNDFDECMGKGAWKRFCTNLDTYFEDNSKEYLLNKIQLEMDVFKEREEQIV